MRKVILAAGLLAAVAGCTSDQMTKAQSYQDKIAGACAVATTLSAFAGQYAAWITAACGSEAAIAKLALDPSSLAWLADLVAKVKGLA